METDKGMLVTTVLVAPCEGVSKDVVAPLREQPAHPIVTIFNNGQREIGCAYLGKEGLCLSASSSNNRIKCSQLFPLRSLPEIPVVALFTPEHTDMDVPKNKKGVRALKGEDRSRIPLNFKLINQTRVDLGFSQPGLAKDMGCSQGTISNICLGRNVNPSFALDLGYRIATFLNIPVEKVFMNQEDAEKAQKVYELRRAREKAAQEQAALTQPE
jgi:DNA-binding XRE family transcriptional regulator